MTVYNSTAGETATVTETSSSQNNTGVDDLTDGLSLHHAGATQATYGLTVAQKIDLLETTIPVKQAIAALSVGVGIHPTQAVSYVAGAAIREVIGLQVSLLPAGVYKRLLADTTALTSQLLSGVGVTLVDHLGVHDALSLAFSVVVVQQLYLSEQPTPNTTFALQLLQGLALHDSLRDFFAGNFAETLGFGETIALTYRANGALAEGLGLTDTIGPQLIFVATAHETIALSGVGLLNMLFSGSITDGIELGIAFTPGGTEPSITTWAINTRTNAVTQYDNFHFDSFTQAFGHKYLGGNRDGLYELNGATDDGANIIADLKSGLMQVGGSKLASFKAVYIGMRTAGDYVLRLETGDGRTYDYAVKTQHMLTTKINLGKGLRARYFSFELIGTGADMDLDTIEFVPVVAQRRV